MARIKNFSELNAKLDRVLGKCMQKLTLKSEDIVDEYIANYYSEWTPRRYKRTKQFLNSCTHVNAKKIGDTWFSMVYINYRGMSYTYDYGDEFVVVGDGYDVAYAANQGWHGVEITAEVSDMHFWDDSVIDAWNNLVMRDFIEWLETMTSCKVISKNGWMML